MVKNIKNKKILIAEDEEPMLQALIETFKNEKFDVFSARDGKEGLRIALKEHPHLLLIDIIMPKMDGFTMLKEIRKDEWGKDVPVIIISNLSDVERIKEINEQYRCDYLIKTECKLDDLVKKVKKLIRPVK
jgi:DNA-binding response OmpR family regulator